MGLTYLDSCVVLDALANPGARGESAREAIESADADRLVTSPLVELECLVRPMRRGDNAMVDRTRKTLARFRQIEIPVGAFRLATHLRAIHGMKTADALHVAAASIADCSALWTSDRRLLRALPEFATDPASL